MTDKITIERQTLLPCPFCGGEAETDSSFQAGPYYGCNECGVWRFGVSEWNRRAALAARPADDGEWTCQDCKGSGDSGRTSQDEANRPVPCPTCMGLGTLDHDLAAQPTDPVEPLAWCSLTASGKVAYFDGKPMVMVGPVGNEHHQTPLYPPPAPAQPAEPVEPDMRHPKIQALIRSGARYRIEQQIVEQLLEDPNYETTAIDMEYWGPIHDKLRAALTAAAEPVEPTDCGEAGHAEGACGNASCFPSTKPAHAVPPGYALVPIGPTEKALLFIGNSFWNITQGDIEITKDEIRAIYRAVLAAGDKR